MIVHGRHDRLIPVANAELDRRVACRTLGSRSWSTPDTCTRPSNRTSTRRSPHSSPRAFGPMRRGDDLRVADVIRDRAAERRDAIAIVQGARGSPSPRSIERSNRLAQALLEQGVGPGDTHRLPRPHRSRGDRTAIRRQQDRGRDRADELAAGGTRAVERARGQPRAGADRRRHVRGARGRSSSAGAPNAPS